MNILSIDPGIQRLGYAVFRKHNSDFSYIKSGLITTKSKTNPSVRLKIVYNNILSVIKKNKIQHIVLEQLFFFKNQKSIIQVAQVQGIIMLLASQYNITLSYLTPLQIKEIVTGYGSSDKQSVQKMIQLTLHLKNNIIQDDQADAVACGLAFCYLKKLD